MTASATTVLHCVGGVCLLALGVDALLENTVCLRVTTDVLPATDTLPTLPRMVLLSDLHHRSFGRENDRLVRTIAGLRPEVIAITGDFVSRDVRDCSPSSAPMRLLRRLCALAPVCMVAGNHELDLPPACAQMLRASATDYGAIWLDNQIVTLCGLPFAGLSLTRAHYRRESGDFRQLANCTAADVTATLGACPPHTILLAHNPLFAPAYAEWGAALVLSGHVHGGVVRAPFVGGLLSPERRFFPRYDKGLYRLGDTTLLVSAGLGKLRLGNPPELRLLTSG